MKKLKVIIEGPDNVGKSTLIRHIIKEYKMPVLSLHYYSNPDKEQPVLWGKKQYHHMFKIFAQNDYVISDRAHLGELVYPKMYGGYDGTYVKELENFYNTDDIFLLTLIDDPKNLIDREDGESFSVDYHDKKQEIDLFIEAHEASGIKNKMMINIKDYNEEQVKEKVLNFTDKMGIWQ